MQKSFLLILAVFTILSTLHAQNYQKVRLPYARKSEYRTTFDSSEIKAMWVDTIMAKLEMRSFRKNYNYRAYKTAFGFPADFAVAFSFNTLKVERTSYLSINNTKYTVEPEKPVFIYGFSSFLGDGKKQNQNFSTFLFSAYRQEQDAEYANNPNNFIPLVEKDAREFKKRNWINMGYGASYLAKDNPFYGQRKFNIGFLHTIEALHYLLIVGGPFLGQASEDKIAIPIIGISSLAIWKYIIANKMVASRHLKLNRNLRNSGYKIPKELKY